MLLAHTIEVAELTGGLRKYSGELSRTGVCIFFLISGFLLYRPFVAARWRNARSPGFRGFARRRLLRIVPAYWLALAVVVAYYGRGVNSDNWLIFPAFGQIYRSSTFDLGIAPAWTLCVEMSFYALLPLYALLARRLSTRADSPRSDVVLLVILAGASLAFHAHYAGESDYMVASMLPGTFYWFALGMGLAVASVASAHSEAQPAVLRLVRRAPTLCWVLALAAFGLLLTQHQESGYSGSLREHVLCGVVAVLVLLPAVFDESGGGLPRRILGLPALAWIGVVSYGVYLWHPFAIRFVHTSSSLHPLAQHYALFVALSLCGAIILATGSYYVLERPVLRLNGRHAGLVAWGSALFVSLGLFAAVGLAARGNEPVVTCRVLESATPSAEPSACRPEGYSGQTFSVGGGAIRSSEGRRIPVVAGRVSGHVDVAGVRGSTVEIGGWAATVSHRPVEAVLVFADERFVAALKPTVRRPDIARAVKAPEDDYGYYVQVPLRVLQPGGRQPVIRLFAVESGMASRVRLDCAANPPQFGC